MYFFQSKKFLHKTPVKLNIRIVICKKNDFFSQIPRNINHFPFNELTHKILIETIRVAPNLGDLVSLRMDDNI